MYSKIQLYPHIGLIFKALRPPNYGYSLQYSKHHFPPESALLNSKLQVIKHYITMTTGTTTNSNKHVVMIHKCIIDRLTLTYLLTYLLTTCSRVLLEKLTGSAATQEIPRIFGTRRFITVLTSARHLSLS